MTQKYLVISGGSRGIGLATVKAFARQNYRVINLSRSKPSFEGIEHIAVDFADIHWADNCREQLSQTLGDSQVTLVHNSGALYSDSVEDVSAEQLQRALQINVVAASQLNQLVLPYMEAGSSILYVASTLGEKAVANACSYVTSKHAMIGLMKSTCQDLFGRGIHTAAICPGFTDTEMLRDHIGNDPAVVSDIVKGVSFGRLISPEEIAQTLWFGSQSPAINGAVLHANLGQKEH